MIYRPRVCVVCGEYLEGDGYKDVLHCPDAPDVLVGCAEPDAEIIYCVQHGEKSD